MLNKRNGIQSPWKCIEVSFPAPCGFYLNFFSDNPVLLDGDLFMRTAVLLRGYLFEKIRFKTGIPFFFFFDI